MNLRVFPRVKVLLTVLQLPTTIAKRRKGNSFCSGWRLMVGWNTTRIKILCTVKSALSLAERIPSIKIKMPKLSAYNFGEACLIKWPSDSTADTWTSETSEDHLEEIYKHWRQSCISPFKMHSLGLCRKYATLEIQKFADIASWFGSSGHCFAKRNGQDELNKLLLKRTFFF